MKRGGWLLRQTMALIQLLYSPWRLDAHPRTSTTNIQSPFNWLSERQTRSTVSHLQLSHERIMHTAVTKCREKRQVR
ncbi:uncharacterized protein BKA55DRAFT_388829 [Fusarium redolens]|uniref:Secreted protein n=1 Tax=Fusarium redolens TaxID=48865 RepID=A0A9P9H1D3_FUSRE|nr:uncharacterized protein BKA55DRAFT_388829 [Fusarium redolens]KAH7248871.1 hypothetical protein BKA55DRAFT_388829 [Fusarium redolens]